MGELSLSVGRVGLSELPENTQPSGAEPEGECRSGAEVGPAMKLGFDESEDLLDEGGRYADASHPGIGHPLAARAPTNRVSVRSGPRHRGGSLCPNPGPSSTRRPAMIPGQCGRSSRETLSTGASYASLVATMGDPPARPGTSTTTESPPPPRPSRVTVPPCSSATALTIASPSPAPRRRRHGEWLDGTVQEAAVQPFLEALPAVGDLQVDAPVSSTRSKPQGPSAVGVAHRVVSEVTHHAFQEYSVAGQLGRSRVAVTWRLRTPPGGDQIQGSSHAVARSTNCRRGDHAGFGRGSIENR